MNVQSTDVQEGDVRVAVCALPVLAATLPGPDQYLLAGRGGMIRIRIRDTDKPS